MILTLHTSIKLLLHKLIIIIDIFVIDYLSKMYCMVTRVRQKGKKRKTRSIAKYLGCFISYSNFMGLQRLKK